MSDDNDNEDAADAPDDGLTLPFAGDDDDDDDDDNDNDKGLLRASDSREARDAARGDASVADASAPAASVAPSSMYCKTDSPITLMPLLRVVVVVVVVVVVFVFVFVVVVVVLVVLGGMFASAPNQNRHDKTHQNTTPLID